MNNNLKSVFLIIFFCLNFFCFEAQVLDSLKNEFINSTTEKEKCNIGLQIGIENYKQGKFKQATLCLNNTLILASKLKDVNTILKVYNNLGNIAADNGDNPKALINYQKALAIAEQINDTRYVASLNKNIGALFVSWKRFDESLTYYFNAEKLAIELEDSILLADCNNNIGTVYEQQNQYKKAIERYTIALDIYKKYCVTDGVAMSYGNLAIVYKLQKKYDKAIEYNLKSVDLSKQLGDKWAESATLNNIGNLYGEIGNYALAIDYCQKSLSISRAINAPEITYNVYESMADAAVKAGKYKEAYNFHHQYTLAKDSFVNTENNKQLSELKIKYETEKKEIDNQQLKFENELKTTQTQNANTQRNWIIIISVISLIVAIIVFKLIYKSRQAKEKLLQQTRINETAFNTEQAERSRIARDLHDSVGQKLSVVKMQLSMKGADVNMASNLLDESIQEVRSISHNLMPYDLHKGLIVAIQELSEQFNFTSTHTKITLQLTEAASKTNFPKQTELSVYRVVQEITTNALKYAKANNIHIDMDCSQKKILLNLKDDGVGFNIDALNGSKGIGLTNMRDRIEQLNGTFIIQSSEGKGTHFKISISL